MNLTNYQRLKKLLGNLVKNPDLIVPYFRQSVLSKRLPIDHGLPWWSYKAIARCDQIAQGRKIFEWGTGGSTLRYGAVAKSITCVEDDVEWLEVVRTRLEMKGVVATLHYRPFDFLKPIDFEDSDYLHAIDGADWDLLIIDGQDWTFKERLVCFRYAERQALPGDVVVLDDFWRYEVLLQETKAKDVEVYESVGPSRIGVTSTAFFFY